MVVGRGAGGVHRRRAYRQAPHQARRHRRYWRRVEGEGGASPEAPPSEAGSIEVSINTTTTATTALLPGTLDLIAARKAVAAQKAAGRWSSCAKERESSEPRTWTQALYDDLVGGR